MEHSHQYHLKCVNDLCRACGERSIKSKNPKKKPAYCQDFKSDLLLYYRINIDQDETDKHGKHSSTMCEKCRRRIFHLRRRVSAVTLAVADACREQSSGLWTAYRSQLTISECRVCAHHQETERGICRGKQKYRTSNLSQSDIADQVLLSVKPAEETTSGQSMQLESVSQSAAPKSQRPWASQNDDFKIFPWKFENPNLLENGLDSSPEIFIEETAIYSGNLKLESVNENTIVERPWSSHVAVNSYNLALSPCKSEDHHFPESPLDLPQVTFPEKTAIHGQSFKLESVNPNAVLDRPWSSYVAVASDSCSLSSCKSEDSCVSESPLDLSQATAAEGTATYGQSTKLVTVDQNTKSEDPHRSASLFNLSVHPCLESRHLHGEDVCFVLDEGKFCS